jgi:NTP pyrophosphatase (non-canonical NTP hydrolase)
MKISKFQDLMRQLYINQDRKRGLDKTFLWLVEEVGELASCLNTKNYQKENLSEELADIIAWTCSIANLTDIDLEDALKKKYPNKCVKCNSSPCKCGHKLTEEN